MSRALVSFDTDKIKNYIFATSALKEIVGASALIDDFNRREMINIIQEKDPTAEKVFADAGAGLFDVNLEEAESIVTAVENEFKKKMITGSISGAWIEQGRNGTFQETFKLLALRLREKKNAKNYSYVPFGATSFTKTCTSCGSDYAQQKAPGIPEKGISVSEEEFLCLSCCAKREKDREMKKNLALLIQGKRDHNPLYLWDRLINALEKELSEEYNNHFDAARPPETFSDLADLSEPSNYMALIYADGDSFGAELARSETIEDIKNFSETVDKCLFEALFSAILKHLPPKNDYFPFNLLFHGGDDLVMVTRADKGVEVAKVLCEHFANNTSEVLGYPLTMSASVIITHGSYPFSSLIKLAEGSLAFAKMTGSRRKKDNPSDLDNQGFINFQVIHSSSGHHFQEEYKRIYTEETSNYRLVRTFRPYTCAELEVLLELIKEFKAFPRNKLYALQESLFMDYNNSVLHAMSFIPRLDKQNQGLINKALKSFADNNKKCIPPWVSMGANNFYSPFMDIVELYSFIGRR